MVACVQPGVALGHDLHAELLTRQTGLVDRLDFELSSGAGLHRLGDVHHLVVMKYKPATA